MMKRLLLATVLGSTALVPASAYAQNQTQPGTPQGAAAQQNQAQQVSASDFVNRAAMGNQFEIQSSQLAQQKGQNERVRQFAQRMIQDHTAAGDRLQSMVQGMQGVTMPSSLDQRHQQMLQTLQNASGPGFDRNYVQLQIGAHRDAVALYDQYAQNGDNQQLKQFAQQTLPTLREHLQQAQQIQTQLPPAQVGQAPDGQQMQGQQTAQNQQAGSRILVQQAAPTVRVDPADPRVIVRQQQPQVTVNQAQPEILVRQPQPTVRVDIPQPEIIVRMPQPDVNVALAQPQVQVRQPQPQVQVTQPQQPQVQVERSQPQVMVQRQAGSEAQVQVQRAEGQPTVRYERAEPRVVVNQAEGQPNVRIERQGEGQQASAQTQQRPEFTEEQRRMVSERLRAGDDVETTAAVNQNFEMRPVAVSDLEDTDVYNARGDEIGQVDRVIVTPQGRHFVVVGAGGFLGIGRDTVAFPLERFGMRNDRLVIRGVTEQDIEAMDDYRDRLDSYQRVDRTAQAELRIWE
ncbi:DUF4142 domain-containing protein [Microvirga splendida]|uniref:DUF4142 domain-containing protein n=1 Tax=Microvirga splendida TaxID=2795727 RepID=A0ABS0Y443_9HYPH|nr:DUF4142 domain-containing protein [Microvirga splendida]MBJ6126810.1 DUF4142 domain-containing protein [Microvirga splendida]